jgi:glutamate--cysteine ligase
VINPGERPLHALRDRGVEYVEVRLMDLNPFHAIGIDASTVRMLDVFLLHCALTASPPDTPQELAAVVRNKQRVASCGREPGLRLSRGSEEVSLSGWGTEILGECSPFAAALDAANGGSAHRDALESAVGALHDPASTPSARVLQAIARDHGNSYVHFALAQSRMHREAILALPLADDVAARYARLAEESIAEQRQIEASETIPFEAYRQLYLAPLRLSE